MADDRCDLLCLDLEKAEPLVPESLGLLEVEAEEVAAIVAHGLILTAIVMLRRLAAAHQARDGGHQLVGHVGIL